MPENFSITMANSDDFLADLQSRYGGVFVPVKSSPLLKNTNPITFADPRFSWQHDAVRVLTENKCAVLISPTGSGKTNVINGAAAIRKERGFKCIIATSQTSIVPGFLDNDIEIDGTVYKIRPVNYTSNSSLQGSTVQALVQWLTNDSDEIVVTSHRGLTMAWDELSDEDKIVLCRDKRVWLAVDEYHHAGFSDSDVATTRLGEILNDVIAKGGEAAGITATNFRTDRLDMFASEHEFTDWSIDNPTGNRYHRTFLEHWKTLNLSVLKYLWYGYAFGSNPLESLVNNIKQEPNECHIVCVPPNNTKFRSNSEWLGQAYTALVEAVGGEEFILNMVDDDAIDTGKEEGKRLLLAANNAYKETGEFPYKVILSCNVMREGTDCVRASRVHDLAPSESVSRTVQTIGRLTRYDKYANKQDIAYNAYFESVFSDDVSDTELRQRLLDRINVGMCGMLEAADYFSTVPSERSINKVYTGDNSNAEVGSNKSQNESVGGFTSRLINEVLMKTVSSLSDSDLNVRNVSFRIRQEAQNVIRTMPNVANMSDEQIDAGVKQVIAKMDRICKISRYPNKEHLSLREQVMAIKGMMIEACNVYGVQMDSAQMERFRTAINRTLTQYESAVQTVLGATSGQSKFIDPDQIRKAKKVIANNRSSKHDYLAKKVREGSKK